MSTKVDTSTLKPIVARGALSDRKAWAIMGYAGASKDGRVPLYLLDGTPAGDAYRRRQDVVFKMAAEAGKARRAGDDAAIRPATEAEIASRYGYSPKRRR